MSQKAHPSHLSRGRSAPRKPRQEKLPLKQKFEHGGYREGAGRPESDFQTHSTRETLTGKHPLHITFKIKTGLPNLRQKRFYQAFKKSVLKAQKKGLNLLHFSILSNHVHMIVEIADNETLHSALKSLNTAFAKRVNFLIGRVGAVLRERFHMHILKTPTEYIKVLRYVLMNAQKHGCIENEIDLYSSAMMFGSYEVLIGERQTKKLRWPAMDLFRKGVDALKPLLSNPTTWLARNGWVRGIAAA